MSKYNPKYLNNEEKELLIPLEDLDTEKIEPPTEKDKSKFRNAAKQFIKKETKMNIRIAPYELQRIKEQSAKEGLKYQAFVKSVLHKYLTGQLIDKNTFAG
ncbi:MAG: antitoxin [Thermodesulfobacteriota bacterium]|nr:antitoxin [Thermodesulfobacteriota bacterium]